MTHGAPPTSRLWFRGVALSSSRPRTRLWLCAFFVAGTLVASCDGDLRDQPLFTEPAVVSSGAEKLARVRVALILERDAQHFTPLEKARLGRVVVGEALHEDIDPLFILALIAVESEFRTDVVSPQGATGLMQLQPATARWIARAMDSAVDGEPPLTEPRTNVRLGVRYFAYLHKRFGSFAVSLEAYNRGPNHPELWLKGLEDNPLGDRFWQRVLLRYREYRDAVDGPSATTAADPIWGIGLGHAELAPLLSTDPLDAPLL